MRFNIFSLAFGAGFLIFNSCATEKNADEQDITKKSKNGKTVNPEMEVLSSEIIPDELPIYRSSRAKLTDLVHTNLEVSFVWAKQEMNGTAHITAMPHFYATDSLILDAKAMEIKSVMQYGKPLLYSYEKDVLSIKLSKQFQGQEKYIVDIEYVAKPEARVAGGSEAIQSDKGLFFINPLNDMGGHMPQIWTQGETEASSVWFPTIDAPNQKTTQQIAITVDKKYLTLSNGKLVKQTTSVDGMRTDVWMQDKPHAPYLFMMGVGEFAMIKDEYKRIDGSKMEVNYYVEPEYAGQAKAIFGETPAMIGFFSKLLGIEYVWDKYSQIIVRDYVSGAMENTGAVTFGDYAYKDSRELLDENDNSTIAHELFHHWFGDLVTCESWSNLTVNESFANYSQYLWDEYRYGLDEADYQGTQEMKSYFSEFASGKDHNLVEFGWSSQEDMFDRHTYNKGGRILHMLRNHIGDAAFFKSLNLYLEQNKYKAAEAHNLRLAIEEVTGQDLNWFFNQWYYGSGFPTLAIDHNHEAGNAVASINVKQTQADNGIQLFRIPIEVAVYDDKGVTIHKIELNEQNETFNFPVSGTLKTIVFDHQHMLLTQTEESKTDEMWLQQYKLDKRWKGRFEAFGKIQGNEKSEALKLALTDSHWSIRAEAINSINELKQEESLTYRDQILKLTETDKNFNVRIAGISFMEKNVPPQDLPAKLKTIITSDSSYNVASMALATLYRLDPKLALTEARIISKTVKSPMLNIVASIVGASGDKSDLAFFENDFKTRKLKKYDGVALLNGLAVLAVKLDTEDQTKIVTLLSDLKKTSSPITLQFLKQVAKYIADGITKAQATSPANTRNVDALNAMAE